MIKAFKVDDVGLMVCLNALYAKNAPKKEALLR